MIKAKTGSQGNTRLIGYDTGTFQKITERLIKS